ncbi:MAG: hypothetical protein IJT94_10765 [Oscillibacter sp.]|nr:hypothetical protein [Oscillibacter sp.]
MKIHVDLPGGGSFEYERDPLPKERFDALVTLAEVFIAAAAVLGFFALFVGAMA